MKLKNLLLEAEYTHIGYGKYKEKGKEKDPNAQTFKKTDQGKYIPIKSDEKPSGKDSKKDTPKVNIFDKPAKKDPKSSSKKSTPSDMGVDSVVYNTRTKTVGIVRMADERGETKTDADGNVNTDELEPYNPMKYPHQKDAQVAPSTQKEIDSRGLWKPFAQSKDTKSDTPKVPSTKLTKLMPKANKDTFSGNSDINKIPDAQKKEISMRIDKLAELTKQAKEKGEAAPNFNLCKVTVPGTNLYCEGNAGIPREEMPQFKGKPTPGSPASKMPLDASGEVDTEPVFKKMLKEKGIKTAETEIPSDALKATQSELVGSKVAGMAKALEKDPNHPGITAPIYVSRDGFVIDGHHRWAAVTSAAIQAGKPANMKVIVIDMDIKDAIPLANKFAEEIGVAAKKADANKETPSKEEPTQSSKYDTSGETDYFEEYDQLPDNIKDLIDTHFGSGDDEYDYKELQSIQKEFEANGWTFDFGLDASPYELKPLPQDKEKSKEEPTNQPKQQRKGNPQVNKDVKGLAEKEGFTPQKLGKEDYIKKMYQAAVSALSDANFHQEARELIAKLEGKPEWAKKPQYPSMDDPNYEDKIKNIRTNSSEASVYMKPDGKTWDFGRKIAQKAEWGGVEAADGIAFTLRMNGFHKQADMIQSVFDDKPYMKAMGERRISLKKLVEAKKYDIGSGYMGNGLTIWNRAEEEHGDYKIIAHISPDGKLSVRDKQLPNDLKKMFQVWADSMKKGNMGPKY